MMKLRTLAIPAAVAILIAGPALAAPPGNQGNQGNHASHADHSGHGQASQTPGNKPATGKAKPGKTKADGANGGNQYNGMACPPGLAKKSPGCVPPGQWKKGDLLPESWAGHYSAYNTLPQLFRDRYANRADRRYVYQNDKVFVIDAASRAVVDILTR